MNMKSFSQDACARALDKASAVPLAYFVILAVSAAFVTTAFVAQYVFDVEPCVLCLWQRVPYVAAAALSLVGVATFGKNSALGGAILWLCALAFLCGMGLAVFHTGVEQHWWLGTSGCAIRPLADAVSALGEAVPLREQLLNTVAASCDRINWTFLGLSMANWNVPASLALFLFALRAAVGFKNGK